MKRGLGWLLDNYGRRFHEAKIAGGRYGTRERADAARLRLVKYIASQVKNAAADRKGAA